MHPIICALALSLLTTAAQEPATRGSSAEDRDELLRLEQAWNQAHLRGDAEALEELWAEEFVATVPGMPVMRRREAIGIWRTGRMSFRRYDTSEVEVRVFGDAAVVTGRVVRAREIGGQAANEDWRFTKMYVRRAGRWQVVAWHASPGAPE